MRILMLGAGGTAGYFGGRLAEAGADVTFLVRPARAARLAERGLEVTSPFGDLRLPVRTVTAGAVGGPYDLVVLGCKAYDLDDAILAVAPAVGPDTMVLPLLNGLAHLDTLDDAFGRERVVGGLCHIGATMGPEGQVIHFNRLHAITFGERAGGTSRRVEAVLEAFGRARFDSRLSADVLQDMWEKYVFLATLAGMTCLMRAPVGAIMATDDGEALTRELFGECRAVAAANAHPPRAEAIDQALKLLIDRGSSFTASMLRDIEAGNRTEGAHIFGDLLGRARAAGVTTPVLRTAWCHLQSYEARRAG